MDASEISPADMSHAMLVAILMHAGGSLSLPASAFELDALGGADGAWHAVGMEPQTDGTVRLTVQPRPDVPEAGMTIY
ncbi:MULTISPECIES: pRL2-19 [unclassified Streptomyces]|uniref:pRL2-19 n=1 Tax=unclassified Streptomyces TaxID=2593676 RepID=UPI0038106A7F